MVERVKYSYKNSSTEVYVRLALGAYLPTVVFAAVSKFASSLYTSFREALSIKPAKMNPAKEAQYWLDHVVSL